MEQFNQAPQLVDAGENGRIPEQVRMVAEESVKRIHEAYTNLNSAAQEGTQSWKRILHANYETAREMERKCLQNTATNVDAAFVAARSIAAARTIPEAAQLYAKFVEQQFAAGSAQVQELLELSQHVGAMTANTSRIERYSNEIRGYANEAAGNVKQGVGKVVGSDKLQVDGRAQELKGEVQVVDSTVRTS